MGPTTQFNATLPDWNEEFQDGFTEFKTGTAADDGFDFAPFSQPPSDKAPQEADQDTTTGVDSFGDSFVAPSNNGAAVASDAADSGSSTADTSKVDIVPVVLAPEVQKDPVIEQNASTTPAATPSESSAGATVQIDKVPLADPEAPKLQATEPSNTNTPKESTADPSSPTAAGTTAATS